MDLERRARGREPPRTHLTIGRQTRATRAAAGSPRQDAPLLAAATVRHDRERSRGYAQRICSASIASHRAHDAGVVLVVGRPPAAAVWLTCSEAYDLSCINTDDVQAALDLLYRISPIALVVASTLDEPSLHSFCDGVRRHGAMRYVPIVASGPGEEALRRRSRDAGVDAYVPRTGMPSPSRYISCAGSNWRSS
jgi:hypothetical protein